MSILYNDPLFGPMILGVVQKANPYHDATGAFTTKNKAIMSRSVSAYPKAQDGRTLLDMKGNGGLSSLQQFTRPDGTLTPERQALHDAIVEEALKDHKAPPSGEAVTNLTGGGGASGKTVIQKNLSYPEDQVHVDVDLIRVMLPEWKQEQDRAKAAGEKANTWLGTFTHEEASLISKRIIDEASKKGFNLFVDGAGDSSIEVLEGNIRRYRSGGQRIVANYVTVNYDEAYARMRRRGDITGRYIPAAHLRAVHAEVSRVFPQAIERGLFDEFTLWDTSESNPGRGLSPYVKVASGRGNTLIIHDRKAWDAFLEKGKGFSPREGEI